MQVSQLFILIIHRLSLCFQSPQEWFRHFLSWPCCFQARVAQRLVPSDTTNSFLLLHARSAELTPATTSQAVSSGGKDSINKQTSCQARHSHLSGSQQIRLPGPGEEVVSNPPTLPDSESPRVVPAQVWMWEMESGVSSYVLSYLGN